VGSEMGIFRIEKNATVIIDGAHWRIRRKRETRWQLEDVSNGEIIEKDEQDLLVMHYEGTLRATPGIRTPKGTTTPRELGDAGKEELRWRLTFVMAVKDLPISESDYEEAIANEWKEYTKKVQYNSGPSSSEAANSITTKRNKPPHWSTVYRWVLRYKLAGNDAHALGKKDRDKSDKANSIWKDLIDDALEEEYLTRERNSLQEAINCAKQKTKVENNKREKLGILSLKLPSRRDVQRRLALISAFDIYAARFGRQAALTKFRSVAGHRTTKEVLERVEIDHTPLDLFVVDDETGIPLGRPYITMCIDDFSRCILGMYVGFIPPSYQSVALCLKHAFFAKISLQSVYPDVEHSWIAFGVMRTLVVDQAAEFHSEALEDACNRLGIHIEYAPRKQGWYKAKIERALGRLNKEVAHGTHGTTFSNIAERGDYNPEKFADIRISTLKLGLHMWVCDIYHEKPHHALGMPPAMMWKLNIQTQDIPLPHDRNALDIVMGRPWDRTVTHKGIEFEGLYYGGEALHDLRIRYGWKLPVEIRVDESDLGHIHVIFRGEIVVANALRFDYANGLSLWLHKQIRANTPKYDCDSWLAALARLRALFKGEREVLRKLSRKGKGRADEAVGSPELTSPKSTLLLLSTTPDPGNTDEPFISNVAKRPMRVIYNNGGQ
jgi:putative transposase